jgi:hypothetical protein
MNRAHRIDFMPRAWKSPRHFGQIVRCHCTKLASHVFREELLPVTLPHASTSRGWPPALQRFFATRADDRTLFAKSAIDAL